MLQNTNNDNYTCFIRNENIWLFFVELSLVMKINLKKTTKNKIDKLLS